MAVLARLVEQAYCLAPRRRPDAERQLIQAAREQHDCDFTGGLPLGAEVSAEQMVGWGEERVVRAELVTELLQAGLPVMVRGWSAVAWVTSPVVV